MTEQDALVADVLAGFEPIGEVPENFADFVAERIAARPSPKPPVPDALDVINRKLDEVLALLRGTPE